MTETATPPRLVGALKDPCFLVRNKAALSRDGQTPAILLLEQIRTDPGINAERTAAPELGR